IFISILSARRSVVRVKGLSAIGVFEEWRVCSNHEIQ
ncbi:MAG: hypothetical protein JWO21_1277, partial [Solirubrobacterales bacterium]|nr:hypothetical protein [Solirubrobacterales bacterium]